MKSTNTAGVGHHNLKIMVVVVVECFMGVKKKRDLGKGKEGR